VKDGKLAHAKAYGKATLEPSLTATTATPYSIGSISKQSTAALICDAARAGKAVARRRGLGKWLPDLTQANETTIRQLLEHINWSFRPSYDGGPFFPWRSVAVTLTIADQQFTHQVVSRREAVYLDV